MPKDTNLHKAAYKGQLPQLHTLPLHVGQCGVSSLPLLSAYISIYPLTLTSSTPTSCSVHSVSSHISSRVFTPGRDLALSVIDSPVCYLVLCAALLLSSGDVGAVEELLDSGEDVNTLGAQNRTPLHRAVGKGHNPVVQLLIQKGADLNLTDGGGLTALHWAALFGLVQTAQILCEAHADINAQTKGGETPLHLSAEKGKVDMVKYLLEQGAKTDIRDKGAGGGGTPFDTAKKAGMKEVMVLLKPAGGGGGGCCVIS